MNGKLRFAVHQTTYKEIFYIIKKYKSTWISKASIKQPQIYQYNKLTKNIQTFLKRTNHRNEYCKLYNTQLMHTARNCVRNTMKSAQEINLEKRKENHENTKTVLIMINHLNKWKCWYNRINRNILQDNTRQRELRCTKMKDIFYLWSN